MKTLFISAFIALKNLFWYAIIPFSTDDTAPMKS